MAVYDRQLDYAYGLRTRIFDLPGHMLDRLAERVIDTGWVARIDFAEADNGRRLGCACRDAHGWCGVVRCRCVCHVGQEYVPVRGWLPAAQAQADRSAWLDEDAAIERAYEHERDV